MTNDATYRRVAILRCGEFTDMNGRRVSFSDEDLRQLAENYDPNYSLATINIDHRSTGPALGIISDLVFDGEFLLADISGVPGEVASEIDRGRYPFRSAEIYSNLDDRGIYLRGVALLGARPPAVKGLPSMPRQHEVHAEGITSPGNEPTLTKANQIKPITFHIFSEVIMEKDQGAVMPVENDKAVLLAEENRRLMEENRELKRDKRKQEIHYFMDNLRASGQLTPAMEARGLEEALLVADENELTVNLPEGRVVLLGEVIRDLMSAVPVTFNTGNPYVNHHDSDDNRLTEEELSVANQLGLSASEFQTIKQYQ